MSGCLLSHRYLSFTPCPALSLLALRIFFYAGYSGARPSGTGDPFSCRNVCVPAPASLRCEALFVRKCYGARPLMLEILFRAGMYVFRRSTSWHWRSFFVPECMCSGARPPGTAGHFSCRIIRLALHFHAGNAPGRRMHRRFFYNSPY